MSEFIPGIFNYCDRWCERCAFTARCRVYSREQQFMEREVLAGNDPNSMESAMRSVSEAFSETFEMIAKMAAEEGIDLEASADNADEVESFERDRDHPLFVQASGWGDRLETFIERMNSELPTVGIEVGMQFAREHAGCTDEIALEEAGESAKQTVASFRDATEVLRYFRYFIAVKIGRATAYLHEVQTEDDLYDANGTAKLVCESLNRVVAALWICAEFHRAWTEDAISLVAGAEALRREIDLLLPGNRTFIRPGIDAEWTEEDD